jgi:hypothetical protein
MLGFGTATRIYLAPGATDTRNATKGITAANIFHC